MNLSHVLSCGPAPWFPPVTVVDKGVIAAYKDGSATLPGAVPRAVTTLSDCFHHIAVSRHHLGRNSDETAAAAQTTLARVTFRQQARAPFDVPIPPEYGFGISHLGTRDGIRYGGNLSYLRTVG